MRKSQQSVTLSPSKRDVTIPRLRQAQADADDAAALKFGVVLSLSKRGAAHRRSWLASAFAKLTPLQATPLELVSRASLVSRPGKRG